MSNIDIIREEATKILDSDQSGHGMDHVNRVAIIASRINENEKANEDIVLAIALLHDVDDYKLFGAENAKNLTNTRMILDKTSFNEVEKEIIINAIHTIGYSKRISGIVPEILEARIVSDADMLDAMGAIGILRSYAYNIVHDKPFFDRELFPNVDMDATQYKQQKDGSSVNHLFEKILKLKDLMLTEKGKEEAVIRYNFVVEFLREYFYELDAKEWIEYLENYTGKGYMKI